MRKERSFTAMYFAFAMIIFNISLLIINHLGSFGSTPVKPLELKAFGFTYQDIIIKIAILGSIGSAISYALTKSAMAVIIPMYITVFWTSFSAAYFGVLEPLFKMVGLGWLSPFFIFLAALVFFVGAIQLATGGWKSYV